MLVVPQYEEFSYQRRVPEQELLHQVLVAHLETFLDRTHTDGSELPRHVEQELRDSHTESPPSFLLYTLVISFFR